MYCCQIVDKQIDHFKFVDFLPCRSFQVKSGVCYRVVMGLLLQVAIISQVTIVSLDLLSHSHTSHPLLSTQIISTKFSLRSKLTFTCQDRTFVLLQCSYTECPMDHDCSPLHNDFIAFGYIQYCHYSLNYHSYGTSVLGIVNTIMSKT